MDGNMEQTSQTMTAYAQQIFHRGSDESSAPTLHHMNIYMDHDASEDP